MAQAWPCSELGESGKTLALLAHDATQGANQRAHHNGSRFIESLPRAADSQEFSSTSWYKRPSHETK